MPSSSSLPSTASRSRVAGLALLDRLWNLLGEAEMLLLLPPALLVLARLHLHPRIDAAAAAAVSLSLPLILGMVAMAVPARILRGRRHRWTVVDLGHSAAVGLGLTLALAMALGFLGRFGARPIGILILAAGVGGWMLLRVLDVAARGHRLDAEDRPVPWLELAGGLVAVGLGLGFAAWYRVDSPVPFHLQWDGFVHLRIVDAILAGGWSPWTTDYSTTFRLNAYFPLQQLLTAVAANLTGVNALDIYWGGPFAVMPIVGVLGYAVARALRVRQVTAVLVAGASLVAGFAFQATDFLGLLPLTLAFPFFSLVLVAALGEVGWPRLITSVVVLGIGAFFGHWLIGSAVIAFGIGLLVLRALDERIHGLWVIAAIGAVGVTVVMVLGYTGLRMLPSQPVGISTGDDRNFGRIVSLATRERDFSTRLSPILAFGSAIGAILLGWRAGRRSRRAMLSLAWSGALVALFLPVAGADRAFAVLPAILAPPLAVAIDAAFDWAVRPGRNVGERGIVAGLAMTVVIALAIQPVLWVSGYQHALAAQAPFFSSFAPSELRAGDAIRHRTPTTTFLISDPLSQGILGGLGNRESYGGGPYTTDREQEALQSALLQPDSRSMWQALTDIGRSEGADGPLLVTFSGRTGEWLRHPIGFWPGYYAPLAKFTNDPASPVNGILQRLGDQAYFQPFWLNDDIVVAAVRSTPDQPVDGLGGPWIGSATNTPLEAYRDQ